MELGDSKDVVLSAMGSPNGHKADKYESLLGPGMTSFEWASGTNVFLATFTNGRATNLQAYDQEVGPIGARGIPCEPFRNQ